MNSNAKHVKDTSNASKFKPISWSSQWLWSIALMLIAFEIGLLSLIIKFIPYTEIDWIAYMQEVSGVLVDKQYDYQYLKGDTGPLVYPGGFVWLYSILYHITQEGIDINRAQWLFAALYVLFIAVVLSIYIRAIESVRPSTSRLTSTASKVSLFRARSIYATRSYAIPLVLILVCISRRIHSIFVLRLFNDCWAMLFMYIAILAMCYGRYWSASFAYTVALSIKMNVLLYLPPFMLLILKATSFVRLLGYLIFIAAWQLLVAIPFLQVNAWSYLVGSFDFGRKFFHIWTVNFKFLPEELFLSDTLSKVLLVLHVGFLLVFLFLKWTITERGPFRLLIDRFNAKHTVPLSAAHIVTVMFTGNFIGIAFCRSLHFQFYVWYYHTLPFLLWLIPFPKLFGFTAVPHLLRLALLAVIELVWNIFPSNAVSSIVLQLCHAVILMGLLCTIVPSPTPSKEFRNQQ